MESAVDAFRVYLRINPPPRPVLEADVHRGTFLSNLSRTPIHVASALRWPTSLARRVPSTNARTQDPPDV
jgi:hypothetical protein